MTIPRPKGAIMKEYTIDIPTDYETVLDTPYQDCELEALIGVENLDSYDFEAIRDMVTVYSYYDNGRYWKDLDADTLNAIIQMHEIERDVKGVFDNMASEASDFFDFIDDKRG